MGRAASVRTGALSMLAPGPSMRILDSLSSFPPHLLRADLEKRSTHRLGSGAADRGCITMECRRMAMVVRALGPGEERRELEIVNSAIRGLASRHYPPSAIAGWLEPETDDNVRDLIANADREIRLIAELDGVPSGIGALVVERSSYARAMSHLPLRGVDAGGCWSWRSNAWARTRGLTRHDVASSPNAEPFYARLGYQARHRHDIVLGNGHRPAAVMMDTRLE